MIGYLMWKKDWNYEEAQLFVKARRGVSSPNTGFICQLLFLEKRLHDPKRETRYALTQHLPSPSFMRYPNIPFPWIYRIYHVTNHSRHDTRFLVGKNIKSLPSTELESGNSESCYIVQIPECFYIWVGSKCDEGFFRVAKQTVRRVQAFERATQNLHIVQQGAEGSEFKSFLSKLAH